MATIVHTTSVPALPTSTTPHHHNPRTSTHTRPLDPFPLHITRAIAEYNHALANDPNLDEPPPLIPDSEDDDDLDDADIASPLIHPAEDTHATVGSSPYLPIQPPTPPPTSPDYQPESPPPSEPPTPSDRRAHMIYEICDDIVCSKNYYQES